MGVALRYFTDFGKPALQHITASICGGIYVLVSIVFCSVCTMSSVRKFTVAISSPGEFLSDSNLLLGQLTGGAENAGPHIPVLSVDPINIPTSVTVTYCCY